MQFFCTNYSVFQKGNSYQIIGTVMLGQLQMSVTIDVPPTATIDEVMQQLKLEAARKAESPSDV